MYRLVDLYVEIFSRLLVPNRGHFHFGLILYDKLSKTELESSHTIAVNILNSRAQHGRAFSSIILWAHSLGFVIIIFPNRTCT